MDRKQVNDIIIWLPKLCIFHEQKKKRIFKAIGVSSFEKNLLHGLELFKLYSSQISVKS